MTDLYAESRSKIYSCLAGMYGQEPESESLWMYGPSGPLQEMAAVLEAPLNMPEGLGELKAEFGRMICHHSETVASLTHLLGRLARLSNLEAKAWTMGEIELVVDCLKREREVLRDEVKALLEGLRNDGWLDGQDLGFYGYLTDLTVEYLAMEEAEIDLWLMESSLAVAESDRLVS